MITTPVELEISITNSRPVWQLMINFTDRHVYFLEACNTCHGEIRGGVTVVWINLYQLRTQQQHPTDHRQCVVGSSECE